MASPWRSSAWRSSTWATSWYPGQLVFGIDQDEDPAGDEDLSLRQRQRVGYRHVEDVEPIVDLAALPLLDDAPADRLDVGEQLRVVHEADAVLELELDLLALRELDLPVAALRRAACASGEERRGEETDPEQAKWRKTIVCALRQETASLRCGIVVPSWVIP
jgi:hypothetical protein